MHEIRYALRALRKAPGFTALAAVALALGIGANTAIFSVVHAVILRPLPYPDAARLVMIWDEHPQDGRDPASYPNFLDWQAENRVFAGMGGFSQGPFNLTGIEEPEQITGARVTAGLFETVGVTPLRGRLFTDEEDRQGTRLAIVSEGFWRRRLAANPNALGATIQLNGESHTVVGIVPASLVFPSQRTEVWVPLGASNNPNQRRSDFLSTVARLKPGVTLQVAQENMTAISVSLEERYPRSNRKWRTRVVPLLDEVMGGVRRPLLLLLGAVGCVLLIACANAANLQLARAAVRERELAIRSALGAGRWRITRQMLVESVLVSTLGGALGILLAAWGVGLLRVIGPAIPRLNDATMNGSVLAFTVAVTLLAGILFGLAPAFSAARSDLNEILKDTARSSGGGLRGRSLRAGLVVAEVSLAVILAIGAGLMARSLRALIQADPGFRSDGVLTAALSFPRASYGGNPQRVAFAAQALDRMRAVPGVTAASAGDRHPARRSQRKSGLQHRRASAGCPRRVACRGCQSR
ncbi:MAG: ABC transporter permease [Bryobacteraceae bacterium]